MCKQMYRNLPLGESKTPQKVEVNNLARRTFANHATDVRIGRHHVHKRHSQYLLAVLKNFLLCIC